MKNIKKYGEFLNESKYGIIDLPLPDRDSDYQFLMDICEKTNYEGTMHFYVKDLIQIGTCGEHKLYLNYLDRNEHDERLAYWFVFNEKPDKLYGTEWDSGVIWEEDGHLQYTDKTDDRSIELFPNFIEIITNELWDYPDLYEWCKEIQDMGIKSRRYSRWAIQSSDNRQKGKPSKELTWEEQLDWIKNRIMFDKLLNRRKKPYDEKILKEMETLGEVKYKEKQKKESEIFKKIWGEIEEEEKAEKKKKDNE